MVIKAFEELVPVQPTWALQLHAAAAQKLLQASAGAAATSPTAERLREYLSLARARLDDFGQVIMLAMVSCCVVLSCDRALVPHCLSLLGC